MAHIWELPFALGVAPQAAAEGLVNIGAAELTAALSSDDIGAHTDRRALMDASHTVGKITDAFSHGYCMFQIRITIGIDIRIYCSVEHKREKNPVGSRFAADFNFLASCNDNDAFQDVDSSVAARQTSAPACPAREFIVI